MDSLKDLLASNPHQKSLAQSQIIIKRLKTYIHKKYNIIAHINLTKHYLIIHVPSAAQATILRLDLANLLQIANNEYKLRISLRKPR